MLRNIGSNWFLMAVTGLATYILMPFNLAHLGNEQYGIWLIISALTAYLFLLHLGVPMASVRHMTKAIAAKDTLDLNRVVTSCAVLYLAFGALVGLLGVFLLIFFEHNYAVPAALQGSARLAFVLALVQTGVGFIAFMPYAILSAYQAFVPKNAIMVAAILVRMAVNVVLVWWYPNLVMLGVVMLSVTVFELVASWGYVLKTCPDIRPNLKYFRLGTIGEMVGFSAYVFLMSLGTQLSLQTSALVIGRALTNADVVSFAIPNSLMLILMQFLLGISTVIMPLATNLQTTGEIGELRTILFKWTKISLALSWCAGLFLIIFGPSFLQFWIRGSYTHEAGVVLRILMLSYLVFLPVRAVAVPMLMGLGDAKWPTIFTLVAGVLNVVLSLAWVGPYGLEGVAWGTAIPNLLLAASMTVLVCRALSVSVRDYLQSTIPLSTLGGIAALAVLGWWQQVWHPSGFWGLGVAGVITVVVCGLLWVGIVVRNDPHLMLPRLSDLMRGRLS